MCAATSAIDYGRVLEMMGIVSAAGFTKVSLIAELPKNDGGSTALTPCPNGASFIYSATLHLLVMLTLVS